MGWGPERDQAAHGSVADYGLSLEIVEIHPNGPTVSFDDTAILAAGRIR